MSWMLPASVCIFVAMLVMTTAFTYLYAVYRERHLFHWALASAFSSLRYVMLIVQVVYGKSVFFASVYNVGTVGAALLMLWGAQLLAGRRRSVWLLWLSMIFAAWGVFGPSAGLEPPTISIPIFFYLGTAYIYVGVLVAKSWSRPRPAVVSITSLLFILWGLHQYDYPVLRFVEWFAPVGYGIGGTFTLATSLGIIIMYFEKMRREVEESARSFKALFESSPVPMLVEDFAELKVELDRLLQAHGPDLRNWLITHPAEVLRLAGLVRILDCNRKTVEFLGASSKEEVWKTLPKYFDQSSLGMFREELVALAAGADSYTMEMHARNMAGGENDLLLSLAVPEGHREKLDRVYVSFMDITERKRAELAMIASQERFIQVAEAAQEMIWEVDASGRYTYVSRGVERITGYSPGDLVGKMYFFDLHPEEGREEFKRKAFEVIASGGEFKRLLNPLLARDGSVVWVETNGVPLLDGAGGVAGYRGLDADVTERRKVEEQLRQAQKMEAIGTLAGGIAHDFNNILGAILGYSELTRAKAPLGSEERQNLDEVIGASLRARDLVRQILIYSRQGVVEKREVEIAQVVLEALKLLRATIPTTITINTEIDVTAGNVHADPSQLHQIIMNLCTNAFQAMREQGGVMTIAVRRLDVCPIEMDGGGPAGCVAVEVTDTGTGMDKATLARIFEPYFTTKGLGKGTGLGLATVQGIVREHGGHITVQSSPGKGSTFCVFLPRIEPSQKAEASEPEIVRGSARVLLVDDEVSLAKLGAKMLESLGYKVVWHTDSKEALKTFEAAPGDFDLIVTDQTMPGLTGLELAARARLVKPGVPVVICSGYSDAIDEGSAVEREEVQGFVGKPVDRAKLGRVVAKALGDLS